jgi:hypothetical protein
LKQRGRPVAYVTLAIAMVAYAVLRRRRDVTQKLAVGAAIAMMKKAMLFDGEQLNDDAEFMSAVNKHVQKMKNGKVRARESTRQAVLQMANRELIEEAIEEAIRLL